MKLKPKNDEKISFSQRVDTAIGFLFPRWAMNRTSARMARENLFASFGAYKGAGKNRLNASWNTTSGSADQDILGDLRTLRERSRELNRNDAHASGITKTVTVNVVGTGITPQSRINFELLGITEEKAKEFQAIAELGFNTWTKQADSTTRLSFYEIQALCERKQNEDGDVFVLPLMVDDPQRKLFLVLEVIEADRVTTPGGRSADRKIREGIEIDERGRPVSYWIKKHHPGDLTVGTVRSQNLGDFENIKAMSKNTWRKNVLHLYDLQRPGQTRGVPLFAPAMQLFHDLANYIESELVSARVAACFSAFITMNDPNAAAIGNTTRTDTKGRRIEGLEPGFIQYLSNGEKIEFAEPNKPGGTFDVFVARLLRAIASSIGFSYELVARDYSKVNFSSARAAILEDRRNFRVRQKRIIENLCQPVWGMVLEEMALRGEFDEIVNVEDFFENLELWTAARWNPPCLHNRFQTYQTLCVAPSVA